MPENSPPLPFQTSLKAISCGVAAPELFRAVEPVMRLFDNLAHRAAGKPGAVGIYVIGTAVRDTHHSLPLSSLNNIDLAVVLPHSSQPLEERAAHLARLAQKEYNLTNYQANPASPYPRHTFGFITQRDILGEAKGQPLRFVARIFEGDMALRDMAGYGYVGFSHIAMGSTGRVMTTELYERDDNERRITAVSIPTEESERARLVRHVGGILNNYRRHTVHPALLAKCFSHSN